MNIGAIICEYNPLHNGHKYQIERTRNLSKCDGLIAIMSGNFVQRGEPALIDKWYRTEMALKNGIDLVIELPVVYALSSAEYFANGAVSLLNDLHVVNFLSFGSEIGDSAPLMNIARVLCEEPEEYKISLKEYLNQGLAFPAARSKALYEYFSLHDGSISSELISHLETSNNILGVEYCKSIIQNNSGIVPYTIKRVGGDYNSSEINNTFSSATAIRKLLKEKAAVEVLRNQLPESSFRIIMKLIENNYTFTYSESIINYIKYKAVLDLDQSLKYIPDTGEGLYRRIYNQLLSLDTMESVIQSIKTKRYTYTRISRILTQYFIGFEKFPINRLAKSRCSYIRVLGLNSKGADILKKIKSKSNIDIINKMPKTTNDPYLQLDLASTRAYSIINKRIHYNEDFLKSPMVLT